MSDLSSRNFTRIAWGMVALAIVVNINNVLVLPSLRAPDGFGHFTYIWYLAATQSIPWATEGWSFFHPPLYYAFMAVPWTLFTSIDPVYRLKIGTGLIAMMGIAQAGVAYLIVKRCLPTNRVAQLLAVGLVLFLPLQLFTAGYIGNERMNAVFSGTTLLAILWVLDRPVWSRAVVLGVLLGLALLVKFTALVVVSGAFGTIFLSFLVRRDYMQGMKLLVIVGVVMVSVCGWYYVRNFERYGTPIQMSRDTEMVQRVEHFQTKGERSLLEYVLFDPLIITSPQWPRGIPIFGRLPPNTVRSPLRESVWTGVFANAWFDGLGGQVVPNIRLHAPTRHSGQLILTLALVPTLLVAIGFGTSIRRLWKDGWNDVHGAMLITFAAMVTVFIYGTKVVVLHAAIKATYLTPVMVIFAFWLAIGFDTVSKLHKGAARGALVTCGAVAVVSVTIFTLGAVIGRGYLRDGLDNRVWQNVYGVIAYAGGNRDRARELFQRSAVDGWHLGNENMAAMALEEGRPREAVRYLRVATRVQPAQSFGLPEDRREFNNATQAEYSVMLSVAYHQLGRLSDAMRSAVDAVMRDRDIPEANYNLGILQLIQSSSLSEGSTRRSELFENARDQFQLSWEMDRGFSEAMAMKGVAEALLGDCDLALSSFQQADEIAGAGSRNYPLATGTGDMHSAGIRRRVRITKVPKRLRPEHQRSRCADEGAS